MKIEFDLADAATVKKERETTQDVTVITDMGRHCCRCKRVVVAVPISLALDDVVDSDGRHNAQRAVAIAMYGASQHMKSVMGAAFETESWANQLPWLRAAAGDGWSADSFVIDAIGRGLDAKVRAAGVEEAKKWPAFTDRRKVFRVSSAKFPPGWLTLSFQAHGSKDGVSVEHGYVAVHICPECAPVVFDTVNVDPKNPLSNGSKW